MLNTSFHHNYSYNQSQPSGVRYSQASSAEGFGRARKLRMIALGAIMMICLGLGALFHGWTGDNEVQAAGITVREEIVVKPGDTLWSISEQRVEKGEDVRIYIQKLKKVNSLTSSALQAGQVLQLP